MLFGHFTGKRQGTIAKLGKSGAKDRYRELSLAAGRKFIEPNNFLQRAYDSSAAAAVEATLGAWSDLIDQAAANVGNG